MTTVAPLFPLSAHLLPGGRMSLRIFEPRYIRMVKEACATGSGFVICMLNAKADKDTNRHIYPVGTFCTVVDFDLMDDGLLGITVEGLYCVNISDIQTEEDGLRVGRYSKVDSWPAPAWSGDVARINDRLKEIFDRYPEVNNLYSSPQFEDPLWVIYRWLELLPVNAEQKQHFLQQQDCQKALSFVSQLIE